MILNFLFDYKNGELYWKFSLSCKSPKGTIAGSVKKDNYRRIGINKKVYLAHRLIFMMFHGYFPKFVDHIDGNKLNNYIENLREVTHAENMKNQKGQLELPGFIYPVKPSTHPLEAALNNFNEFEQATHCQKAAFHIQRR